MTRDDEMAVIARVLDGETDAFEALVTANEKNVYNLALRMTKNQQDALDISQDVFLKAYTSLSSFRGECRFSVWLYRMTYNVCIDYIRRTKNAPVSLTPDEDDEHPALQIPDHRPGPAEEAERRELINEVNLAVDELSDEHRSILVMREMSDMSYTEIAQALDINEGTVKSRLSRARRNLAGILIKRGTFAPDAASNEAKGGAEE